MTSFQALQFLVTAAKIDQKQRQTFSRLEITKKLNEIKYLSAQKKVPRLSLRKEILHLEHKVLRVLEFEEHVKKKDSVKIEAMKKEVATLKKKLAAAADKDITKKVDRLMHLLGETLAKRGVTQELLPHPKKFFARGSRIQHARLLRTKLEALKQQLEMLKQLEKDPQKVYFLEQQIRAWELRLQIYLKKHPEASAETTEKITEEKGGETATEKTMKAPREEVKHDLLFDQPMKKPLLAQPQTTELENLFLLPPPPKVKVRKE